MHMDYIVNYKELSLCWNTVALLDFAENMQVMTPFKVSRRVTAILKLNGKVIFWRLDSLSYLTSLKLLHVDKAWTSTSCVTLNNLVH